MSRLTSKTQFWSVVKACLVKFQKLKEADAEKACTDARTRLSSGPKSFEPDVIYHAEPFFVACDITGDVRTTIGDERAEYQALIKKAFQARKPRQGAAKKMSPRKVSAKGGQSEVFGTKAGTRRRELIKRAMTVSKGGIHARIRAANERVRKTKGSVQGKATAKA